VWNLAVEQHAHWRPGRKGTPSYLEQCRQLTDARAGHDWLRAGCQMVQQQALRDFAQAMAAFFDPANPAGRPGARPAGMTDSGSLPSNQRTYVGSTATLVRFGYGLRARETDQRKDWAEKTSTSIVRRFDLIRVEDLRIRNMTRSARGTREDPGRNVRQKAGLNRAILRSGVGPAGAPPGAEGTGPGGKG
jgi:hypothetical protein